MSAAPLAKLGCRSVGHLTGSARLARANARGLRRPGGPSSHLGAGSLSTLGAGSSALGTGSLSALGAVLLAVLAVAGCKRSDEKSSTVDSPAVPLSIPSVLCPAADPCVEADAVERWLRAESLEIVGVSEMPTGIQGARLLTLRANGDFGEVVFRAKWRPLSSFSGNNDPRRELAAYEIQKLFVDPENYIVPPTAGRCFPLEAYRQAVDAAAEPYQADTPCVLGWLSYWLEDAVSVADAADRGWLSDPKSAIDEELFAKDARYRRTAGIANLVAFAISHGDSHSKQFVLRDTGAGKSLYLVDNSLSFDDERNTDLETHDWLRIVVPSLPEEEARRLLAAGDAAEGLAALEEYARTRSGLALVPPGAESRGADSVRAYRWLGDRLQVGLRPSEILILQANIARLREGFERGAYKLESR